jgi:ribonuclease P protein subunit POP4
MNKELIGATMEIVESSNRSLVGKKGKIIDETKNTITIQTKNKKEKILKNVITCKINKDDRESIIDCRTLKKRAYDRIK